MSFSQVRGVTAIAENEKLRIRCPEYYFGVQTDAHAAKGDNPIENGRLTDVWERFHNENQVATKVLKVYGANEIEKI